MQSSAANCGPFALGNGLMALGIKRTAEELEVACGTTATLGTSTAKLIRAITRIEGCEPVKIVERRSDVAMLKLRGALQDGRPVILLWEQGAHWVAAVGMLGRRFLVADAADNELVLSFDADELAAQWFDGARYEGIML